MNSTPLHKFYQWEQQSPDSLFLRQPINGRWKNYSYSEARKEIDGMAAYLLSLNLPAKSNIAILSKNCAHWIMADLAIWASGHVSVPIYPSLSANAINQLLEHSESKIIFVGKLDNYEAQRSGIPDQIIKISFPDYGPADGQLWSSVIIKESTKNILPSPDDIATVMYSSGTTGTPKGVMHNFSAFDYFGKNVIQDFGIDKPHEFFSYLPLSHIAERAYIEMGVLYCGGSIAFAESLDTFAKNLSEVQPVLFGGVPRIYAKFQEGVLSKLSQKKLNILLSIPVIRTLIKKFIQKKIGLSKAKAIVCGAAPIPVHLLHWYKSVGINIHEIYGMTEDCGYSHGDHGNHFKFGSVGRAWPSVQTKLSAEGEILVKHNGLMKGYFKDEETTKAVFTDDGFLKTGDLGKYDDEGFLTITGRVKDQFKTDKGKFVAPAPIESALIANNNIELACVVGIGVPQPMALLNLSAMGKSKPKQEIEKSIIETLEEVNKKLESFEKLAAAIILKQDWTIENGLLTPTLKVKRYALENIYLQQYPGWYKERKLIVWE